MEQILRDMVQEMQHILGSCLDNDQMNRIIKAYHEKIMELMPKQISEDRAIYSNEASYIRGWNACVEKIVNP